MRHYTSVVIGVAAALVGAGPAAAGFPYPTNACVSAKQAAVGRYCEMALGASAVLLHNGHGQRRDRLVAREGARLDARWAFAESVAAAEGAECAETTLSAVEMRQQIDTAVDAMVRQLAGSVRRPPERACAARMLRAAALACSRLLRAEGRYIRSPSADPDGVLRDATRARALTLFDRTGEHGNPHCPSAVTEGDLVASVEALAADVVTNTTQSPHVDAANFTTISPTGSTDYLGRTLTPVCMNGSPYHFFVKRGTVNKLVVYYQGGGACWEQLTCSVPVCDTSVDPAGGDNPNRGTRGFADRNNPANPFRDWHTVFVSYCSCDVHFGDAAQDYPLHVEHRGYHNARIVEKWAREHFLTPETVFVTGSSAGAYGAWFHAPVLAQTWPAARFHVLADAGNGVITQDFLRQYFPNWNFVGNLPPEFPELLEVVESGGGIPGYTEAVSRRFPDINWAHYSTAFDGGFGGQTGFYNLMLNGNNPLAALTWWEGSCAFTDAMRAQAIDTAATLPRSYRYYIGTGSRHTMWGSNKVYTDTTGGVPTIVDWVNGMLRSRPGHADPAWTNVECTNCGLTLAGDPAPSPLEPPFRQIGSDVVIDCVGSASGAFVLE